MKDGLAPSDGHWNYSCMVTVSLGETRASSNTRAYHLDQPGLLFSEILENSSFMKHPLIVAHGTAGAVISIRASPINTIFPGPISFQSKPPMVIFSPVDPGLIGCPSLRSD